MASNTDPSSLLNSLTPEEQYVLDTAIKIIKQCEYCVTEIVPKLKSLVQRLYQLYLVREGVELLYPIDSDIRKEKLEVLARSRADILTKD